MKEINVWITKRNLIVSDTYSDLMLMKELFEYFEFIKVQEDGVKLATEILNAAIEKAAQRGQESAKNK